MSVEFRQRTASDFIRMLKRRKWMIILPILTMTTAIGYVVYQLPSLYESKTLLVVNPAQISEKAVQSLTDDDLTQRLQNISQIILSRATLEPMVAKYKLFELERSSGVPMELIIDKMYKNIKVEPERSDQDRKVAAFRITYLDRSPEAARNVASELASKYVNAQVDASTQSAKVTREFFDNQLAQAKQLLDECDKERIEIMTQNLTTLPDSSQGLVAQLTNLSGKRDSITKEKESLILERGRINDQIGANNRQINTIETLIAKNLQDSAKNSNRLEDNPAYSQLFQKQTELESKLKNLLAQYKDANPKVIAARNDLAEVKNGLEELRKSSERKEGEAINRGKSQTEIQKQGFVAENLRLQDYLARGEQQISQKDQEIAAVGVEINDVNSKINTIPTVKVALESLNNRYQSAKTTYDDLLKKRNDASLQVDVESNSKGETIRVQDPASLSSSPVAPKRAVWTGGGAFLGLMVGLLLAAAFEIPRILRIQNIEDAKHYTGLPILASVPPLYSHNEKIWLKRSSWLKLLAGTAVAIAAIPLIILALTTSHILERIVS